MTVTTNLGHEAFLVTPDGERWLAAFVAHIKTRDAWQRAREAHIKTWEAHIKTRDARDRAWEAYDQAWEAWQRAWEAYDQAWKARDQTWEAWHRACGVLMVLEREIFGAHLAPHQALHDYIRTTRGGKL